ncbi:hypothetical protein [Variovorax ginsengisoli]|uniref:Uncharacterized protein n=1 Tax=Variovorax ginsengisoli TaxID=363844 RepID=A0ABT8SDR9_9BURK|nr:hypothetical protein [Variovorax ginsengisoli]MDN8617888.1 hypothetical protein [Variovorax ginsengisoli]MDO1537058.1 hypothetical protein [Variovorax ginsengisoli]
MTLFLSPKFWLAIAFAAVLAFAGLQTVRVAGGKTELAEERRERAEETTERERIARRATERNRQIEQERTALATAQEKAKDEQILNIDARLRDALGQLSERPDRPAGSGGAAGNPPAQAACTGAGLYRPDAAFLIGEAAAAARVAAERDYCHERYDGLSSAGGEAPP